MRATRAPNQSRIKGRRASITGIVGNVCPSMCLLEPQRPLGSEGLATEAPPLFGRNATRASRLHGQRNRWSGDALVAGLRSSIHLSGDPYRPDIRSDTGRTTSRDPAFARGFGGHARGGSSTGLTTGRGSMARAVAFSGNLRSRVLPSLAFFFVSRSCFRFPISRSRPLSRFSLLSRILSPHSLIPCSSHFPWLTSAIPGRKFVSSN
jgi:hypothetical protein